MHAFRFQGDLIESAVIAVARLLGRARQPFARHPFVRRHHIDAAARSGHSAS